MTTPLKRLSEQFNFIEPKNEELKIIVGVRPYKQKVGKTTLRVARSPQNINYKNFNEIAFLVNKWIKIQDSLEMIFNLLCTPNKSLELLNFLKTNNISPTQFANFLYKKYKIILVNRFDLNNKSQKNEIIKLIKNNLNQKVYVLFAGREAVFQLAKNSNLEFATAIHPSGVVLNTYPDTYYKTWYQLDDNALFNKTSNFTLKAFNILK